MMRSGYTSICAAIILFAAAPSLGQELQCDVTVKTEAISSAVRDYLKDFEADVERYINSTRFTNEDMLGEKIVCNIDIFFKAQTGENRYQVQAFIGSQRPVYVNDERTEQATPVLRLLDEKWEFIYIPGQRMRQDDFVFDPLTDFLDFYAYLIIGLDLESYTLNAGAAYFQKAFSICQQGASTSFGGEWQQQLSAYSRYAIAEELSNPKYAVIKEAFTAYHFDGIDNLGGDQQQALNVMLNSIEKIYRVRRTLNPLSVLVKQFFNTKNREIADAFKTYHDPRVFEKLGEFDPEHLSVYREHQPN
ncbi:MAG: hypothetical protein A2X67_04590 [Ignavibacteria bacterium GWA2_55_11]|nr:MAG: hypothetical protein A2X67_04590 [Ignavibacteria bacterium GWA2_55_11]OGU43604.1 MAG: hypothetical protein A2X68_06280 [Ignavibacteria bacterium GWC2_56_12]OGU61940.1 MAG: hypothetical protein A3C56_05095 [Ignavibacteria bacterium RIFCSPHIGHO2_02_FULL_56_12]OGU68932.1 MAG: hypothetical protein A3H45_00615 [Ignavibacteria bacterium RIFCSPLOWO2_02_FULL_55_14]OGU72739.1 MAG: hypothetical protein A3G43_10240 [Ignavibacteria bacterium RIFCSPLOWO2_12_FULL_56_21]